MALAENVSETWEQTSEGRIVMPGEQVAIDPFNNHEEWLIARGVLVIVDPDAPPPPAAPGPPKRVYVRGDSVPAPGQVLTAQGTGSEQWPEWKPLDVALGDIEIDIATQEELDATAAFADAHIRGKLVPMPGAPESGKGFVYDHIAGQFVWTDLATQVELNAVDGGAEHVANKNQPGGYAGLDGGGKLQIGALPALAISSVTPVASQAAQLALVAEQGDVAVRTDQSKSYIKNAGTAGTMADWTELATPVDVVLSVAGKTGAVNLVVGDIAGAEATANKGAANGYMGLDSAGIGAQAPKVHGAARHVPGGADPLDLSTILRFGTLAARPAASAALEGVRYFATNDNGGTEYQVQGAAWVQITKGLTAQPVGAAGGSLTGNYPNPGILKLDRNSTQFGVAASLYSDAADNTRLYGNWDAAAVAAFDNTKAAWMLAFRQDQFVIWRTAAGAGAPATTLASLGNTGVLNVVGGLQVGGTEAITAAGKSQLKLVQPVGDVNWIYSLGYNEYPPYRLADSADKGLATVIEGNWDDGSGQNKMEWYVQYLNADNTQVGVRRPFMSQLNKTTGNITFTYMVGGSRLSLRINDGSQEYPNPNYAVGKEALGILAPGDIVVGLDSSTETSVQIFGKNDAGDANQLRFVDGNSSQAFFIAQQATALTSALRIGFQATEFVRIRNDGGMEWRNGATVNASMTAAGSLNVNFGDVMARNGQAAVAGIGALGPGGEAALKLGGSETLYKTGAGLLRHSATDLRLGTGAGMQSSAADNFALASNYIFATDREIDTAKTAWLLKIGDGANDRTILYRAPATAGAPAYAAALTITSTGTTIPNTLTVNGNLVLTADLRHQGNFVGFYNVAQVARPAAYTQTYATTSRTHPVDTAADLATTAATQASPWGFATAAQAQNIATQHNALRVDVDNVKKLVNQVIDDLQAVGLLQ